MPFVDVHAHIDDLQFAADLDAVLENAKKAGVKAIINNPLNPAGNRNSLELAKNYPLIKTALGLYPEDALKLSDKELSDEINFIKDKRKKIIALGEIGLDYKISDERERQKQIFSRLLELAAEIRKPVIVHSRKAEADVIELLESSGIKKVVMHCFSGNLKLVKRAAENGWFFSIPTNVVFSQHFQKLVENVNINQILTETDAPWLSPFKGKRNEPAFVVEAVNKIAEIKGFEAREVENNIFMNYQRVF